MKDNIADFWNSLEKDRKLKEEKRSNRYTDRVVKRVQSYGYGKNDKYKNKPNAVCYWTQEGGDFVSYDASKFRMKLRNIRHRIVYRWNPFNIKDRIWFRRAKERIAREGKKLGIDEAIAIAKNWKEYNKNWEVNRNV